MLKRIIALSLVFVMCSLSVMATEVSFYNKNNIQVSQIEDGQYVKVETGNNENYYAVLYLDTGRLSNVKNLADGEVFVSKGAKNLVIFGYDKGKNEMSQIVSVPVIPNDPSNDAEENFITIADVYNNARAMYSLTTDDGYAYTAAFLTDKFKNLDLKGTMGLVTDWMGKEGKMTWEQAEKYVNGPNSVWGVASHTKSHDQTGFGSLNEMQMEIEIGDAYRELKKHFPDEKILAVWPPGGITSDVSFKVTNKYHLISRRTGGGSTHNYLPMIKSELTYLAVYMADAKSDFETMKGWADNAVDRGQWLVEMWHGVGDKDAASWHGNVSEKDASMYLSYISKLQKEGKMWVATIDEAAAYTLEKMEGRISVLEKSDEKIRFALTDTLDDAVYDMPLTLNVNLPEEWTDAKVTQNGAKIPGKIKDGVLTINVKPDSGEVVISK